MLQERTALSAVVAFRRQAFAYVVIDQSFLLIKFGRAYRCSKAVSPKKLPKIKARKFQFN
jgi:hypothetical protein